MTPPHDPANPATPRLSLSGAKTGVLLFASVCREQICAQMVTLQSPLGLKLLRAQTVQKRG